MKHTCIIIIIMAAAGILGGATNFLILFRKEKKKGKKIDKTVEKVDNNNVKEKKYKEVWWVTFLRCLSISLCASFAVPLFLNILSSDLLSSDKNPYPVENYFIFIGFCVISAFFAKRFLEDLYSKVNKLEKDTKDVKDKAEEAKEIAKENEKRGQEVNKNKEKLKEIISKYYPKPSSENRGPSTRLPEDKVVTDEEKIVNAILNSKYNFRTTIGIAGDTNIDESVIKEKLQLLEKEGFVEKKENSMGEDIWGLVIGD